MFIIACLGNPGRKYTGNRHNIGFMVGSFIAGNNRCKPAKKEFSSLTGKLSLAGSDCLIMFPQGYMNRSGFAVAEASSYFHVEPEHLIVIHDELELPFGEIRVKKGGGHKGHNGLRSIMEQLGSPDFYRLRFGIGRPPDPQIPVADYVLADFLPEEKELLGDKIARAEEMVLGIIRGESTPVS